MKHAFLVIAHNEPQVLMALLRQLDATDFDVYLHIDAKAPDMQRQFAAYTPPSRWLSPFAPTPRRTLGRHSTSRGRNASIQGSCTTGALRLLPPTLRGRLIAKNAPTTAPNIQPTSPQRVCKLLAHPQPSARPTSQSQSLLSLYATSQVQGHTYPCPNLPLAQWLPPFAKTYSL